MTEVPSYSIYVSAAPCSNRKWAARESAPPRPLPCTPVPRAPRYRSALHEFLIVETLSASIITLNCSRLIPRFFRLASNSVRVPGLPGAVSAFLLQLCERYVPRVRKRTAVRDCGGEIVGVEQQELNSLPGNGESTIARSSIRLRSTRDERPAVFEIILSCAFAAAYTAPAFPIPRCPQGSAIHPRRDCSPRGAMRLSQAPCAAAVTLPAPRNQRLFRTPRSAAADSVPYEQERVKLPFKRMYLLRDG